VDPDRFGAARRVRGLSPPPALKLSAADRLSRLGPIWAPILSQSETIGAQKEESGRDRRPAALLASNPPSAERVFNPRGCPVHDPAR
jgi:hypothetical protein